MWRLSEVASVLLTEMNLLVLSQVSGLGECRLTPSTLVRLFAGEENILMLQQGEYFQLLTPCGSVDDSRALSNERSSYGTPRTWRVFLCKLWEQIIQFCKALMWCCVLPSVNAFMILKMSRLRKPLTACTWKCLTMKINLNYSILLNSPQMYGFSLETEQNID